MLTTVNCHGIWLIEDQVFPFSFANEEAIPLEHVTCPTSLGPEIEPEEELRAHYLLPVLPEIVIQRKKCTMILSARLDILFKYFVVLTKSI